MKPRITETGWLAATNLIDLDLYRSAWQRYRKWRLFGITCCRQAMTLAPDDRLETLVKAAEQFADDLLTWEEVKKVRRVLKVVRNELGEKFGPDEAKHDVLDALDHVTQKAPLASLQSSEKARYAFAAKSRPKFDVGSKQAERSQIALAYDVFGNPFQPITFSPSWRTDTTLSLARTMYDSRDFSPIPILADALQDAGCDNADILGHCRDVNQPHVRGCWVVDMVLGKN